MFRPYSLHFFFQSVPAFQASQYLITNREFLEFVKAGGYQDTKLWTEEGWAWRMYKEASHPMFWTCEKGKISYFLK